MADLEAQGMGQDYEGARLELVAGAKRLYYELSWVNAAIRTNTEMKGVLSNTEKIAQTQYATGRVPQQDVLKAQVELAKVDSELVRFGQEKTSLRIQLNALLSRSPAAPLGEPEELPAVELKADQDTLLKAAVEQQPMLKAARLNIERSERAIDLAGKSGLPELSVGTGYEFMWGGNDNWIVSAGISLPIWSEKYRAAATEAYHASRRAKELYVNAENQVLAGVRSSFTDLQAKWKLEEIYRSSILPQAEQVLKTAETEYQTGKADFLALLDGVRSLLELKLARNRNRVDYQIGLAQLEYFCGVPIEQMMETGAGR
jgi:outer membrane protein, heavy metal efflux system